MKEPDGTAGGTCSDDGLPSYAELVARRDAPPGSTWGVFGAEDELGTINLLTAERVVDACGLVRTGEVIRLDVPLDMFDPPVAKHRERGRHVIFGNGYNHRDDRIEQLYLQVSSQIDGLRHARHEGSGFYNGVPDSEIDERSPRLGIGRWARHGLVGRGLLVDVEAYVERTRHRGLDHDAGEQIDVELLEAVIDWQGTSLRPGSMLLVRTGWLARYQDMMPEERRSVPGNITCAGLAQDEAIVGWLWDHRVALVASDNPAVEAMPVAPTSPFFHANSGADGLGPGMAHPVLLSLIGLALGELWALDELAARCRESGSYEMLVVSNPLLLDAAVGSPANAVAIL